MIKKLILNEKYCEGDVCQGELGIHRFESEQKNPWAKNTQMYHKW